MKKGTYKDGDEIHDEELAANVATAGSVVSDVLPFDLLVSSLKSSTSNNEKKHKRKSPEEGTTTTTVKKKKPKYSTPTATAAAPQPAIPTETKAEKRRRKRLEKRKAAAAAAAEAEDDGVDIANKLRQQALLAMDRIMNGASLEDDNSKKKKRQEELEQEAAQAAEDKRDAEVKVEDLLADETEEQASDPINVWAAERPIPTTPDASKALHARREVAEGCPGLGGTVAWEGPAGTGTGTGTTADHVDVAGLVGRYSESYEGAHIKGRLYNRVEEVLREKPASQLERSLFSMLNTYGDVLLVRKTTLAERREMYRAYMLHVLNHVLKSRDCVLKHTARINSGGSSKEGEEEPPADQGFTRPRAVVLVPFRSVCWEVVQQMIELLPRTLREHVESAAKLRMMYYEDAEPPALKVPRPQEFNETFRGNADDCFCLGVAFTRGSVRLFTNYYKSDIIIASPLGLRLITGDEADKTRDYDFLSSVEIFVVDQADVIMMQNWDHVTAIAGALNRIPAKPRDDTDFSRVRRWFLDEQGKYYRQNVVITQTLTPEINALFNRTCANTLPRFRALTPDEPSIAKVALKIRQVFQRVDADSPGQKGDALFKYFVDEVLPHLTATVQTRTLVYVASYFDYIRLKNLFGEEALNYCAVCEHTSKQDQCKFRGRFAEGKFDFMLYTERFHFYHRYHIKGAHNVVFYGLPQYGQFYSEVVNCLAAQDASALALFTKYDHLQLERIVGPKRALRLVSSEKSTHLFC